MADNVTTPTTGSGTATPVIATDDIGGVHYQRVKVTSGADGTANDVSSANPLPISAASATALVTVRQDTATSLKVDASGVAVPVTDNSGSLTIDAASATALVTVRQDTATNLKVDASGVAVPVTDNSGSLTIDAASATASVTVRQDTATNLKVDASGVAVPITDNSGSLTVDAASATFVGKVNWTGNSVYSASALSATVQTVSSAAGTFHGGMFINLNSAPIYIQVFDTTGAVTLGTTAPTFIMPIPANSTAANGVAFIAELTRGVTIANGIKAAATTTATGSTGPTTALIGFFEYR